MTFAEKYFKNYNANNEYFIELPKSNLGIVIVIPCYNEPNLNASLKSLANCKLPNCSAEIITVINSSELSDKEIVRHNLKTLKSAKEFAANINNEKLDFKFIYENKLPKKYAGVGLARKIGMDEAVRRFAKINKPEGIIVGFDADAKVEENYFIEIEKHFKENPKSNACSIHFEHPIEGSEFQQEIYTGIIDYELHLRYFINALKFIKFPYSYQTIGSSFAVKAEIYTKQGGMNRKKAGEDFYFLQKIIPLGNFTEIKSTKVIPSPRTSDRVPFGTGAAIKIMISENQTEYLTYNIQAFFDLQILFDNKFIFFNESEHKKVDLPKTITIFLEKFNFHSDLKKILLNSPNETIFEKRFYDWFNTFRVIKFLNFVHLEFYKKDTAVDASIKLLQEMKINTGNKSAKELLSIFREIDSI